MKTSFVTTRNSSHLRARRGSVVLLALTAVAVATLLGLSLAASRDANLSASANLAKAASARAAAAGAMEIAVELLNDLENAAISNGVLIDSLTIGDATVRASIIDLATGRSPDESAKAVEITVVATLSGITQTTHAVGRMPSPTIANEADLDCSEFALLATDVLALESDALVSVWSRAPLAALREPVVFGLSSGNSSGLTVNSSASIHGCVRVQLGSFAEDLDDADANLVDKVLRIPAEIHVPLAPTPPAVTGAMLPTLVLDGLMTHNASTIDDVRVPARSAVTLRGVSQLDIGGTLRIERGSQVRVEGITTIIVRGNTVIESAAIEIAPNAQLTIIALGDLSMDASYLGGERSNPLEGRDASGDANYDGGAAAVTIYVANDTRVALLGGSVLKGEIYAPLGRVSLKTRSAIYGRALAKEVRIKSGTALFYDPALDTQRGWSNRMSGIWSNGATVQPAVKEVTTLCAEMLGEFAARTNIVPEIRASIAVAGDDDAKQREARVRAQVDLARGSRRAKAHGFPRLEAPALRQFYSLGFERNEKEGDD